MTHVLCAVYADVKELSMLKSPAPAPARVRRLVTWGRHRRDSNTINRPTIVLGGVLLSDRPARQLASTHIQKAIQRTCPCTEFHSIMADSSVTLTYVQGHSWSRGHSLLMLIYETRIKYHI